MRGSGLRHCLLYAEVAEEDAGSEAVVDDDAPGGFPREHHIFVMDGPDAIEAGLGFRIVRQHLNADGEPLAREDIAVEASPRSCDLVEDDGAVHVGRSAVIAIRARDAASSSFRCDAIHLDGNTMHMYVAFRKRAAKPSNGDPFPG
jgi:hypothetical protein